MIENLKARCLRYLHYLRVSKLKNLPRMLWRDYHPKLYRLANPALERQMTKKVLPYFKGICIGGNLNWKFQEYLELAKQVIYVDIVPDYPGQQHKPDYLTDAANLSFAGNGEYDFACSSHVLEHIANPIKALREWIRVIRKGGVIYCGVPDKRFTFDYKRPRTSMEHLLKDYEQDVDFRDLKHLSDFMFESEMTFGETTEENHSHWLKQYTSEGTDVASVGQPHYHIFAKCDLETLFKLVGLEVIFVKLIGATIHLVAKKK